MMAGGRPSDYKEEFCEQAYKLCLLGFTDVELGVFFGVCEKTINNWKHDHGEFLQSIKEGKDIADSEMAVSLYQRGLGYSHPEQKIFNDNGKPMVVDTVKHYPPDTGAAMAWLKNRQPNKWRDKTEVDNVNHNVSLELSEEQQQEAIDKIIKRQSEFDDYE